MHQPGERKARSSRFAPSGAWRSEAACRNQVDRHFDPWDSDDRAKEPNEVASRICQQCPVRLACLTEAIANDEPYGTWGGLTRKQRQQLTRARLRSKCPICKNTLTLQDAAHMQTCAGCGMSWRTRRVSTTERAL